nr:ribonuclease H-like domain-containing protein [Tanacetum cinerariifolium]
MRMEQFLTNTDYGLWQVIMNGDEPIKTTRDENGVKTEVPPKTAQALLARQRETKAKSIMVFAIPNEHQLRFHTIKDAKSLWAAIKNELDIDDLYNNLKVFEADIKGSSGSSSNSQNVAFLSAEDTNSINEVNIANGVSTSTKKSREHDNALIVQDGLGYDWSYIAQEEPTEFALMAYTSGSDTEKNEASYEEKIALLEFKVKDKDKTGLEFGDQLSDSDSEVLPSIFDSLLSDGDDNLTNDRFKKDNGYHAVPPPLTGNYMPPLANLSFAGLDDSVYSPAANKASASISKSGPSVIKTSNISVEKGDSVRTSRVIIEDWVSDDEDTLVDTQVDSQTTVKPSFIKIEFTKARNEFFKSHKQADKPKMVTQNSKADRKDWNGNLTQNQESVKKSVLNDMGKGIGQREVRPIWNNTQRINHQNKFVPTAVLTRISKKIVNIVRINGVNTVGQTSVSTVEGNGVTAVKTSAVALVEGRMIETSAKVNKVNDEVRIKALVDGKRVNIKESSIKRILRLDDVEGTSCLTNTEIFEGLARMGYEKPSDKLTFYKAFFSPPIEVPDPHYLAMP